MPRRRAPDTTPKVDGKELAIKEFVFEMERGLGRIEALLVLAGQVVDPSELSAMLAIVRRMESQSNALELAQLAELSAGARRLLLAVRENRVALDNPTRGILFDTTSTMRGACEELRHALTARRPRAAETERPTTIPPASYVGEPVTRTRKTTRPPTLLPASTARPRQERGDEAFHASVERLLAAATVVAHSPEVRETASPRLAAQIETLQRTIRDLRHHLEAVRSTEPQRPKRSK